MTHLVSPKVLDLTETLESKNVVLPEAGDLLIFDSGSKVFTVLRSKDNARLCWLRPEGQPNLLGWSPLTNLGEFRAADMIGEYFSFKLTLDRKTKTNVYWKFARKLEQIQKKF